MEGPEILSWNKITGFVMWNLEVPLSVTHDKDKNKTSKMGLLHYFKWTVIFDRMGSAYDIKHWRGKKVLRNKK